jgi:transposase-like protein
MELLQLKCPACKSYDIHSHTPYTTKNHGIRVIYQCNSCRDYFSETKKTFMEGLKTPMSMIWLVIKARTDGMGLNAATRTFEFAKNTILSWERKFSGLHRVLFLYTLVHQFIEVVIEGDEAYTKVHHNVPPYESSGWTIVLMDRASRFIWELDCGTKDRKLFKKAIATLEQIVSRTNDLSVLTDGERRYGNLLFEVCYELVKNGKRGRPKKTLKRGIRVRIKNKGSQAHKKGRKRPKYQSPWAEHPETTHTLEETDIHANHAEAFWSALRRKCTTFRRKTNMYAKSTPGSQRLLHVYWVVHNFIRVHFTTREVPAVALEVIERRVAAFEIFHMQMA